MKIEVLYVPGCPKREPAVQRLAAVLHAQGIAPEIREIPITDLLMAEDLRFSGSPTVRVNGRDVAPEDAAAGLNCRLHMPTLEQLQRAVIDAEAAQ